jgi:C-terminal processing protease CtpA/Prc
MLPPAAPIAERSDQNRQALRAVLVCFALLCGVVPAAPTRAQEPVESPPREESVPTPLPSGLDTIEEQFITPIPRDELETKALAALLEALDPYSHYLDAEEMAKFRAEALEPGSESASPSASPSVAPDATPSAVPRIDARTRTATSAPSVRALHRDTGGNPDWWLDREGRLGYLRIALVAADTAANVEAAAAALKRGRARGLVLDLRDCPGGLLQPAVDIADLFVARGTLLTVRQRGEDQVYDARPGRFTKLPLAILINAGTASSCEIIAGALADNGRGTLVGERSYGKGRIQKVYTLGEGRGGMVMSTGTFQRPNGKTIDRHDVPAGSTDAGVTPQVEVKMSKSEHKAWLEFAEKNAREPGEAPPDPVLAKAIELLGKK